MPVHYFSWCTYSGCLFGRSFAYVFAYLEDAVYKISFANYFADGMMLQRAPYRAIVWGYAPLVDRRNMSVVVELTGAGAQAGARLTTTVKQTGELSLDGFWSVRWLSLVLA